MIGATADFQATKPPTPSVGDRSTRPRAARGHRQSPSIHPPEESSFCMTAARPPDPATLPAPAAIQQFHHYPYRARDAQETRHFYDDILGLPLYHIIPSNHH